MTATTTTTTAAVSPTVSPTSAPRLLQLVDGHSPTSLQNPLYGLGLSTPPPSARTFKVRNSRRQSSISYFPSDHVSKCEGRPSVKEKSARRSNSVQVWGNEIVGISKAKGDRRSLGNLSTPREPLSPRTQTDHGLLTLTEKHADLLQFIAQKEAKCLELRSQLAVHESELAQLKKKWERIVSRGMDRAYSSHAHSAASPSPLSSSHASSYANTGLIPSANAAIKEGVRLLAAGLELSPPASQPGATSPILPPPALPVSGFATVSRATMKAHARHTATASASSAATSTTASSSSSASASQRLSQSSASSLTSALSFDDALEQEHTRTGPAPIPEEKGEELARPVEVSPSRHSGGLLRRRSHESEDAPLMPSSPREEAHIPPVVRQKSRSHAHAHAHANSHASMSGSSVPPTPTSPMSSLMTSVGRKWEELQRGHTFTKSQKRASLLLSDVSQSIFAALSSPTQASMPVGAAGVAPSKLQRAVLPESKSLLDEEDDEAEVGGEKQCLLGDVLVPTLVPVSAPATTTTHAQAAQKQQKDAADDDDWNW